MQVAEAIKLDAVWEADETGGSMKKASRETTRHGNEEEGERSTSWVPPTQICVDPIE